MGFRARSSRPHATGIGARFQFLRLFAPPAEPAVLAVTDSSRNHRSSKAVHLKSHVGIGLFIKLQ